ERRWAVGLLQELDLPTRLLPELIEPGTILGALKPSVHTGLGGTPVVAPACHDTGSAVAAIPGGAGRAFLSSGTWSLLGTETAVPVITPAALQANFTNEGGVCGTTRLLKNIGGLWPLQACRHGGARDGRSYDYAELMDAAGDDRHAVLSLLDPDEPVVPPAPHISVCRGSIRTPRSSCVRPTWPSRSPTTADGPNSRSRSRRELSRARSSRVSPSSIGWGSDPPGRRTATATTHR